jgi:translation initiation factor IF-3
MVTDILIGSCRSYTTIRIVLCPFSHITERVGSERAGSEIVQVKIGTGEHDLELKAKRVSEWLGEGNRVKIDLFLIGRSKYMDLNFLKERLDRIMKLVTVEYKVAQDVVKGPKGLSIVIEKK